MRVRDKGSIEYGDREQELNDASKSEESETNREKSRSESERVSVDDPY